MFCHRGRATDRARVEMGKVNERSLLSVGARRAVLVNGQVKLTQCTIQGGCEERRRSLGTQTRAEHVVGRCVDVKSMNLACLCCMLRCEGTAVRNAQCFSTPPVDVTTLSLSAVRDA